MNVKYLRHFKLIRGLEKSTLVHSIQSKCTNFYLYFSFYNAYYRTSRARNRLKCYVYTRRNKIIPCTFLFGSYPLCIVELTIKNCIHGVQCALCICAVFVHMQFEILFLSKWKYTEEFPFFPPIFQLFLL